jgi:UDPglucose 6-dehydrogenase
VVTAALGEDSRIGAKYLKSALGYGGPCFPRDNAAFVACSRSLGLQATLAEATDEVNRRQAPRLAQLVGRHVAEGSRVAVLGLSYKPGTSVVDESQGVALARALAASGATVTVYDPAAAGNARREMGAPVDYAATLEECIREADVIVLATPWPEFSALSPAHFTGRQRRPVLIDCWRMWEGRGLEEVADLIRIGAGPLAGSQMREMAQAL